VSAGVFVASSARLATASTMPYAVAVDGAAPRVFALAASPGITAARRH